MVGGCPVARSSPRCPCSHTLSACALTPQRRERGTQIPPKWILEKGRIPRASFNAFFHAQLQLMQLWLRHLAPGPTGDVPAEQRLPQLRRPQRKARFASVRVAFSDTPHARTSIMITFILVSTLVCIQGYQGTNCASCDDCGSCGTRTVLGITITEPGWYTLLVEGCKSCMVPACQHHHRTSRYVPPKKGEGSSVMIWMLDIRARAVERRHWVVEQL